MNIRLVGNNIVCNGNTISIYDLLDPSLYEFSNSKSSMFYNETIGVNEVYSGFIQLYWALERFVQNNQPNVIDVNKSSKDLKYFILDICKDRKDIKIIGKSSIDKLFAKINFHLTVLASALYISVKLMSIPFKKDIKITEKFAVLRSNAAIKKFKRFSEIGQEIESLDNKDSIYRLFPKTERIKWVFKAYFLSYKEFNQMASFYSSLLGKNFLYVLMSYYKKRILYAELYKLMLDEYFKNFAGKEFYSGNNLDRFSVIEDQICKKHCIKSYNIPHGIEYGFKYPKGFSSDVFYVHSQYTADYLNNLYNTTKYVFNESIVRRMFEYNYNKPHDKLVIFFTEPREVDVNINIVKGLLPKVKENGWKLYLKLHPVDNKSNYDGLDVDFITEYELSLTGNICISRKSTILLEAIYNKSLPIAIITTPKDETMYSLFPSLNAKEIIKTYSIEELYNVIKTNI